MILIRYLFLFILTIQPICATQTSLFWTNDITDVLETGKMFLEVDDYFTIFNKRGKNPSLPTDVGLTVGLFTYKDVSVEGSIDYLGGTDDPVYFSAKAGIEEDMLFKHAPACSLGIFNVGTGRETNWNVIDLVIGKTLPEPIGGRVFLAGYTGNRSMGPDRSGFMIGYDHKFCKTKDSCGTEYYKLVLAADYASGKNSIGGGGVGFTYFFNPDFNMTLGPVWFNDAQRNGQWKWAVQWIYIFSAFNKPKEAAVPQSVY